MNDSSSRSVQISAFESAGALSGFVVSGRWPENTLEWVKFLVIAVRVASVPGLLPVTTVFRVREELPDEPQPGTVGLVLAEGPLIGEHALIPGQFGEPQPSGLLVLHPPSETKPSLPEYDGVASGCVYLPGLLTSVSITGPAGRRPTTPARSPACAAGPGSIRWMTPTPPCWPCFWPPDVAFGAGRCKAAPRRELGEQPKVSSHSVERSASGHWATSRSMWSTSCHDLPPVVFRVPDPGARQPLNQSPRRRPEVPPDPGFFLAGTPWGRGRMRTS